jgi:hypothetical protein
MHEQAAAGGVALVLETDPTPLTRCGPAQSATARPMAPEPMGVLDVWDSAWTASPSRRTASVPACVAPVSGARAWRALHGTLDQAAVIGSPHSPGSLQHRAHSMAAVQQQQSDSCRHATAQHFGGVSRASPRQPMQARAPASGGFWTSAANLSLGGLMGMWSHKWGLRTSEDGERSS